MARPHLLHKVTYWQDGARVSWSVRRINELVPRGAGFANTLEDANREAAEFIRDDLLAGGELRETL